jgi:hypothetical protein
MAGDGGELLAHATSFYNPKATTQSRQWEVSILTTYRGGDGPRIAGDGKAARPVLEDDGGSFLCSSGSGDGLNDGGVEGGPSFKRQIDL